MCEYPRRIFLQSFEDIIQDFLYMLVEVVSNGFKFEHFPKWFYTRLSMCFHHIAHYNQYGFYTTWFEEEEDRQEFIERIKNMSIYGDPEYTYSDVEKVLQDWVKENL